MQHFHCSLLVLNCAQSEGLKTHCDSFKDSGISLALPEQKLAQYITHISFRNEVPSHRGTHPVLIQPFFPVSLVILLITALALKQPRRHQAASRWRDREGTLVSILEVSMNMQLVVHIWWVQMYIKITGAVVFCKREIMQIEMCHLER